jgi:hypothetical protein
MQRTAVLSQLEELRGQAGSKLAAMRSIRESADEQEATMRQQCNMLSTRLQEQRRAKQRILALYLESCSTAPMGPSAIDQITSPDDDSSVSRSIDLSSCGLGDEDVRVLTKEIHQRWRAIIRSVTIPVPSAPRVATVNLSGNAISDAGAKHIAEMLKGRNCCGVEEIDLRHNAISMEGVRGIAEALEHHRDQDQQAQKQSSSRSSSRSIQHIFVHQDGRIEALGCTPPQDGPAEAVGVAQTIVSIDARSNVDLSRADASGGAASVPSPFVPLPAGARRNPKKNLDASTQKRRKQLLARSQSHASSLAASEIYAAAPAAAAHTKGKKAKGPAQSLPPLA